MSAPGLSTPTAEALARQHPEFRGWLGLLDAIGVEAAVPAWADAVPEPPDMAVGTPLLAGTRLAIERDVIVGWLRRLFDAAAAAAPALTGAADRLEPLAALEAALALDTARIEALADAAGLPRAPTAAVLPLAACPWLQASAARMAARVAAMHKDAWCPICGAWATLAEARGLEGTRYLRCGRCGADWRTEWLRCPFCGTDEHARLRALVGEDSAGTRRADGCAVCGAWVKTITTLSASDVRTVRLLDLATVGLDVAALERGWRRPTGLGASLGIEVVATATRPARDRRWWRR